MDRYAISILNKIIEYLQTDRTGTIRLCLECYNEK